MSLGSDADFYREQAEANPPLTDDELVALADDDERPVHQPPAYDAPIPGRHWYAGCDPDRPRVEPDGVCEGCGARACPVCGRGDCPDHPTPELVDEALDAFRELLGEMYGPTPTGAQTLALAERYFPGFLLPTERTHDGS